MVLYKTALPRVSCVSLIAPESLRAVSFQVQVHKAVPERGGLAATAQNQFVHSSRCVCVKATARCEGSKPRSDCNGSPIPGFAFYVPD